jgi:hypothetical protein
MLSPNAGTSPRSFPIPQGNGQRPLPNSSGTDLSSYHPNDSHDSHGGRIFEQLPAQPNLVAEEENSRVYFSDSQRNLTDNVIHTLVSKPNDALALLFEAAGRQDPSALNSRRQSPDPTLSHPVNFNSQQNEVSLESEVRRPRSSLPTPHSINAASTSSWPSPSAETIKLWGGYRFVRQGWLTAREAIHAVDL